MTKDPYRYFRIEAQELVEGLGQGLLELEKGADPELVRRLLRHAHTFKGAARVVRSRPTATSRVR
jgi:two-component system chemotaxis sensor kinase CheA